MEDMKITVTITPEVAQAIVDAAVRVWEAVVEIARRLARALAAIVREAAAKFRAWLEGVLHGVNPRLCHLAFHAKRHRVRKKNMRRLLRQLAQAQGPVP